MKRILGWVLVCALMGGILMRPALAAPFPDVGENASYAEAVEYLKNAGVMQGDNMGRFNPSQTVTRAEMAAITCRMLKAEEAMSSIQLFYDVPTNHWANKYVAKAEELGIVRGYGNGAFGPSDQVTYEQVVTMLVRTMGKEQQASQLGGYPNGYIAVAKNVGMLSNVPTQSGRHMLRSEIAMMAFNCRDGWGAVPERLADGEYSVRISADDLKRDQAGNELITAEILEPVVLSDELVRSLKVGDKIPIQTIFGARELEVSELDKADDDIWINDYTYLARYKSGWVIVENVYLVKYIAERREIQVPPSAKIIDDCTALWEPGEFETREFESLQAFFEHSASYATIWSATITITSGKVTEVFIPYTPVGW